jgi:hypothetical protein
MRNARFAFLLMFAAMSLFGQSTSHDKMSFVAADLQLGMTKHAAKAALSNGSATFLESDQSPDSWIILSDTNHPLGDARFERDRLVFASRSWPLKSNSAAGAASAFIGAVSAIVTPSRSATCTVAVEDSQNPMLSMKILRIRCGNRQAVLDLPSEGDILVIEMLGKP